MFKYRYYNTQSVCLIYIFNHIFIYNIIILNIVCVNSNFKKCIKIGKNDTH